MLADKQQDWWNYTGKEGLTSRIETEWLWEEGFDKSKGLDGMAVFICSLCNDAFSVTQTIQMRE
jgi:hypothetical protein